MLYFFLVVSLLPALLLLFPITPLSTAALARAVAGVASGGGAVVVMDARSGAELHSAGFTEKQLPPGSIFKLVTTLAAAAARPRTLSMPRLCPRKDRHAAPESEAGGHGWLGLEDALARSCNAYFAGLGNDVGATRILDTLRDLGLGAIGPPLPTTRAEELSIGAGALLSARQQAALVRIIVSGRLSSGRTPPGVEVLPRLREGMCRAVREGTARLLARAGDRVLICGKTGTAALGEGTIGWFAGFAPAADPSIIVVVGVRGASGWEAAGAARPIFEAYFYGR